MGQYFVIVNEEKEELLHPYKLGSWSKFWEMCANKSPFAVLGYLLFRSSDRSIAGKNGGEMLGRWAGDRIVTVGDYDDSGLYQHASDNFKDISDPVREEFNKFMEDKDLFINP